MKRLRELNTKENLWVYILRVLKDKPMHAYALRDEVERRFSFRPGTVTAYKVLYLLSRSGMVSKKSCGRQKVYSLTAEGKVALKEAVGFYKERIKLLG